MNTINKIMSLTYRATEHLSGYITPDITVDMDVPKDLQEDMAIMFTMAMRKRTAFHGNGACFLFDNSQLQSMQTYLNSDAPKGSLAPSEERAILELINEALELQKDPSITKSEFIKFGVGAIEQPHITADAETMNQIFHVWTKMIMKLRPDSPYTKHFDLDPDEKQHFLSHGVFGGALTIVPNKIVNEWTVVTEGFQTQVEKQAALMGTMQQLKDSGAGL